MFYYLSCASFEAPLLRRLKLALLSSTYLKHDYSQPQEKTKKFFWLFTCCEVFGSFLVLASKRCGSVSDLKMLPWKLCPLLSKFGENSDRCIYAYLLYIPACLSSTETNTIYMFYFHPQLIRHSLCQFVKNQITKLTRFSVGEREQRSFASKSNLNYFQLSQNKYI